MLPHIRRFTRVLLACGLLCAFSDSVVLGSRNPASACEELKAWASSYAHAAPTLDEFSRFDRAQRVAIFNAISPQVRVALWQEQFTRFAERSDLTTRQRSLLSEARNLVVPALYLKDGAAQAATLAFWDRAKTAFASEEHQRVFFDLGVVVSDASAAQSARRSDDEYCECNQWQAWPQCMGASCSSATCISFLGCGPFGGHTCNGMCDW